MEKLKDQFVTYEIALQLKELGFNEPCFGWCFSDGSGDIKIEAINNQTEVNILMPLWQQAIDWLRDEKGAYISFEPGSEYLPMYKISFGFIHTSNWDNSWKEVKEGAILKVINIIKERNNIKKRVVKILLDILVIGK